MRIWIAATAVSLTVAFVALIFALWPVVAHAPWENSAATSVPIMKQPTVDPCVKFRDQLVAAAPGSVAYRIVRDAGRQAHCWK